MNLQSHRQPPAAAAANLCPHCFASMGNYHAAGCPDGSGRVGMPDTARLRDPIRIQPVPATHKKTSNPYLYLGLVLDLTGTNRGHSFALYASECKSDVPIFVRDLHEFWERFEPAVREPILPPSDHLKGFKNQQVIEKATSQRYLYLCDVLDCTNARDDVPMVLFTPLGSSVAPWFICDKDEFWNRFELVQ